MRAPVSATLLGYLVAELGTESAVSQLLRSHPAAAQPLFELRVLACVHRLALTGRAPRLAEHLVAPSDSSPEELWPLVCEAILAEPERVAHGLGVPIQQHDPARAGALLEGLARTGLGDVRLLEIGACAGLSLILDRYHWTGPGWTWGDPGSPVRLSANGPEPRGLRIVERAGCDLCPRDPANPGDVAVLRSFLPPEDVAARRRLDLGLEIAARAGKVEIQRCGAAEWLEQCLAGSGDGLATVLWHSMVWQYLDRGERAAIERVLARSPAPVWRIAFEPPERSADPCLRITRYGQKTAQ